MKKKAWGLALCMLFALLPFHMPARAEKPHIGMMIYNGTDAFMSETFTRILQAANDVAEVTYLDSKNSQITQNDQVEALLKAGVDALIINTVDRTAAIYLIRMVKPYDVPIVFINREPLYEDLVTYDKAYYVGNNPTSSGTLCGELLADYFDTHPEADKNGDGIVQYIMLKGEPGHQDAELRTVHAVKAMQARGYTLEKLAEETAMWERSIAQDKMSGYLSSFGERIECVIANNDEMALGAIEALKAAGYFTYGRFMPVVGVDATSYAMEALREGTLLGTVLNDQEGLSDAALRLALLLAEGEIITEASFPYPVDQDIYVWTESRKITAATLGE